MNTTNKIPDFDNSQFEKLNNYGVSGPWPMGSIETARWVPKKKSDPVEHETNSITQKIFDFLHRLFSRFLIPSLGMQTAPFALNCKYTIAGKGVTCNSAAKYILVPVKEGVFTKLTLVCNRESGAMEPNRVFLYTPGNAQTITSSSIVNEHAGLAHDLKAKGVVLDYRLYGENGEKISTGVTRDQIIKIHQLALRFIEEELKGTEIILIGYSLGAGVQAESLARYEFRPGTRCVSVSLDTFNELAEVAANLIARFVGDLIKYFNWNLETAVSLKKVDMPHIVVQSTCDNPKIKYEETNFTQQVKNDGVIYAKAALATELSGTKNTHYYGVRNRGHNEPLKLVKWGVVRKVLSLLKAAQH